MLDDDVAAALCAISAFADVAALESTEEFLALGNTNVLFLPQGERADWRGGITPAIFAVTITHLERIAAQLDLHRPAVTSASMRLRHRLLDMI
jgi:hypothetical protein